MKKPEYNYKLLIAYDGTEFQGWQVQTYGVSIQGVIEKTIERILQAPVRVVGSGRTDAGVHARGQVAHFKHHAFVDLEKLFYSLNSLLPKSIRVLKVEQAPLDFHAQKSAIGKIYCYHMSFGRIQNPFERFYRVSFKKNVDIDLLKEASQKFLGTHDFTSFANEAYRGSASRDPVRTIKRLDLVEEQEGYRLEFEADGFLYKMVRNITGILLEVAEKKRSIDDIPKIFLGKDRRLSGQAAPPHGLFLEKVLY